MSMRKRYSDNALCWLCGLLSPLCCLAQPTLLQPSQAFQQPDSWPERLPAFIDNVVVNQLLLYDIPGAAVALVHKGEVLYLSGYGYADRQTQQPVRAQSTLFGTGSISKTLTSTAVMQMVERGSLGLYRDINEYLAEWQIPATFPQPITLAHLLTHTAGFEERVFGFHARSAGELLPLASFLKRYLPARVFAPGEVSAYSNYGTALAGHIIERVGGLPFAEYIETNILTPLGMTHSSFRQPLPPALYDQLATGYRGKGLSGREWYNAGPAGAFKATAADMARFMLAHLRQGLLDGRRILSPPSVNSMQTRQFSNHPAVSGLTFGFQELQRGDRRIIWHPGDTLFFTAGLFLLPELELGLYAAYNRGGLKHSPPLELFDAVLERIAPPAFTPPVGEGAFDPMRLAGLSGNYRSTRSGSHSLEKLLEFFSPVNIRDIGGGLLRIRGLDVVEESRWAEQAPYLFKDIASEEIVAFRHSGQEEFTFLFEGNMPVAAYFRLPWYGAPEVHYLLLGFCGLVFLTTVCVWPVQAWRCMRHPTPPPQPFTHLVRRIAGTLCLINLIFLTGMLAVLKHLQLLLFGIPPLLEGLLLLPLLSAVLTLTLTLLLVTVWRRRSQALPGRLHLTLVAIAAIAFLWSLYYWRLL